MKITKLAHACLLVEMPSPVNRTVLFDPGVFSKELITAANLVYLDDIVITHEHSDHFDLPTVKTLAVRFPDARVLGPEPVVAILGAEGVQASTRPAEGLRLFLSPHEPLAPLGPTPAAIGVHYLDTLSHPGDSHSFSETKAVLALPVTAPWGTTMRAAELTAELKPKYVVPIHDAIWKEDWRQRMYDMLEQFFAGRGIEFIKPVDGQSFVLDV